ncbi:SGNH/GDSL hydrolase family protein [Akkermansiaceae bacterium]|nr:SGNH/GDSL hydrolase family protein [Akkermansiaceae bacterium]MDA7888691.1 SGNH/GDSL hydrolase family protein [Akkermansiaceae bacterium]
MNRRFFASSLFVFVMVTRMAVAAEPGASIAPDNGNLHIRAGLPNLKQRLEVEKECHVAFLGGSITENTGGHTKMVPAWLKEKYPEVKFTLTNVGLGSTCSTSGAFRVASHIFGKGRVDLLIVEFAVNDDQDAGHAKRECLRGMEGIIRQVHRDHPKCDIVMVHYVNPGMLAMLQKGEVPTSIAAHEEVANRHGVISVNVAAEVAEATMAKRYTWKDYGGTHPGKFGYRVASNMIIAAIKSGLAKTDGKPRKLQAPLDKGSYDQGGFVELKNAKLPAKGWRIGKVGRELLPLGGIRSQYESYQLLRGDQPGSELKLSFEGRAVGAFILAGPDAGIVETSIDGGEFKKQDLFHRFSGGLNYPRSVVFASDLAPGKHELTLRLSKEKNAKSKGATASVMFFEVNR